MAYWGTNLEQCDASFDATSHCVWVMKKKLYETMQAEIENESAEAGFLAILKAIRLVSEWAPKASRVVFHQTHLRECREGFEKWRDKCGSKIPTKIRESIFNSAEQELNLFAEFMKQPYPK